MTETQINHLTELDNAIKLLTDIKELSLVILCVCVILGVFLIATKGIKKLLVTNLIVLGISVVMFVVCNIWANNLANTFIIDYYKFLNII